jgi:hypothetical protein
MNPTPNAVAELQLALKCAEARMDRYTSRNPTGLPVRGSTHADNLNDHRTEVAGDFAEALDHIDPGLGERFMQAMFPELPIGLAEDFAVVLDHLNSTGPNAATVGAPQ